MPLIKGEGKKQVAFAFDAARDILSVDFTLGRSQFTWIGVEFSVGFGAVLIGIGASAAIDVADGLSVQIIAGNEATEVAVEAGPTAAKIVKTTRQTAAFLRCAGTMASRIHIRCVFRQTGYEGCQSTIRRDKGIFYHATPRSIIS